MKNMAEKKEKIDYGEKIASWKVPEHESKQRGKGWYISASIAAFLLLLYSFFSANFLFAVIIIVVAIVIILNDGQDSAIVQITMTDEGMVVGRKFYDYDELKNFAIVYKPKQDIKNLYFEFKNIVKPRLSIPLGKTNPLLIRDNLLKYLDEDLDRTDQPLSEELAKMFRL